MYVVQNTYETNMKNGKYDPNRTITGTITLTNGVVLPITDAVLKTNTLDINNQCASNSLEIGSTNVGECTFEFNTSLYIYDLYDAEVKLYYDAWGEHIPLGVFFVTEAVRKTSNWLSIKAYDSMSKFDENLGNFSTNGTAYSILVWLCRQVGITLGNTEAEINQMENSDVILNISSNEYNTYREALKDVSAVLGGFSYIDRFGQLKIGQYRESSNYQLTARERISAEVSEYKTWISEIDITVDSVSYKATTGTNDGLTYALTNKMIKGLVSTIQPIIDNILDAVKAVKYTPADYKILYNPIFDLGDMVEVPADGRVLKNKVYTVITSFDYRFQGTSSIKGVGESIFLSKRSKSNASTAADSAIAIAKNNGTYIETYSNVEAYSIGTTRKNVVTIEYGNGTADVIVLHGQCCINCTTPGTVQLIYGVDGEDESFSPKKQLVAGYNIIDFYCYYLEPEQNWLSYYTVDLVSEDAVATIAIGDIRADVMATMYGNGRFLVDNIFDELIPYYRRTNNNYLIGEEDPFVEEEEE